MPTDAHSTEHMVPMYPMTGGIECSWCGSDHTERADGRPFKNREGESFCCKNHRDASTRALHRLQRRYAENPEQFKILAQRDRR